VVSGFNTLGNTDLEFPLSWGDFSVQTGNVETRIEAASDVSFSNRSSEGVVVTDGAVISALGIGETTFRPSEGPSGSGTFSCEEEVFLFNTEPWVVLGGISHDSVGNVSEVALGRGFFVHKEGFAHNEDVVTTSEGIGAEEDGFNIDFGVFSAGLIAAGSVIGPPFELFEFGDLFEVGLGLASEGNTGTIYPDVFSENPFLVGEIVFVEITEI
jgi:hypothetical protein